MSLITSTAGTTTAAGFRSEIVMFGDSITQEGHYELGWGVLLQKYFRRRADVLNRGFGGYNTRRAVAMLPFVFPSSSQFLLSTVCWGANDSVHPSNALQHVPLEEFQSNLIAIYTAALAVSRFVVAITPPPVDSARWPDRSVDSAGRYSQAVRDAVAAVNGTDGAPRLLCLDAYALMLSYESSASASSSSPAVQVIAPSWHALLSDGLHLSPTGNAVLVDALAAVLQAQAPSVSPAALTLDFPVWREVGNDTAVAALTAPGALAAFHSLPRELP